MIQRYHRQTRCTTVDKFLKMHWTLDCVRCSNPNRLICRESMRLQYGEKKSNTGENAIKLIISFDASLASYLFWVRLIDAIMRWEFEAFLSQFWIRRVPDYGCASTFSFHLLHKTKRTRKAIDDNRMSEKVSLGQVACNRSTIFLLLVPFWITFEIKIPIGDFRWTHNEPFSVWRFHRSSINDI